MTVLDSSIKVSPGAAVGWKDTQVLRWRCWVPGLVRMEPTTFLLPDFLSHPRLVHPPSGSTPTTRGDRIFSHRWESCQERGASSAKGGYAALSDKPWVKGLWRCCYIFVVYAVYYFMPTEVCPHFDNPLNPMPEFPQAFHFPHRPFVPSDRGAILVGPGRRSQTPAPLSLRFSHPPCSCINHRIPCPSPPHPQYRFPPRSISQCAGSFSFEG